MAEEGFVDPAVVRAYLAIKTRWQGGVVSVLAMLFGIVAIALVLRSTWPLQFAELAPRLALPGRVELLDLGEIDHDLGGSVRGADGLGVRLPTGQRGRSPRTRARNTR